MSKYCRIAHKSFMGIDDLVGFLMTNTIRKDGRLTDIKLHEVSPDDHIYNVSVSCDGELDEAIDILERYGFTMYKYIDS